MLITEKMNFDVAKLDKRVKFSEQIVNGLKSNDCVRDKKWILAENYFR